MKLVLLFFCILIVNIIILLFSTISLNIKNIKISNFENGVKKPNIEKNIIINLEIYLFRKFKIAKFKLNQKSFNNWNLKIGKNDLKTNIQALRKIQISKILKLLKIQVKNINFLLQIGTEEILSTVFLVTFISTLIRNTI